MSMDRPPLEPAGSFRRIPLQPHQMRERLTPTQDVIVLCHLGVPRIDRDAWSLSIDGLVNRPARLRFSDLTAYPRCTITSIHQCAGNPLQPFEPTRRISNVRWSGARLSDILRDCEPSPEARFVWSSGADYGAFGGIEHREYRKDLPLERVASDVLVAYELNGASLAAEHGFPARLVVPGFYGTNSVKWLTRMTLAATRADGPFTTRWYSDPVPDAPGMTAPVWSIAPESLIVAPAPGESVRRDTDQEVWGWAWADAGIERVDISDDGGATWTAAKVEAREGRAWQRWSASWRPARHGAIQLCSRAVSRTRAEQPMAGRRNAVHSVEVRVV